MIAVYRVAELDLLMNERSRYADSNPIVYPVFCASSGTKVVSVSDPTAWLTGVCFAAQALKGRKKSAAGAGCRNMSSTAAATKHRVSISSEATPLLLSSSSRRRQRSTEALGLVLMTLAAFGFSSMSLFVKLSTGFPSFEIVLARSVLQAVFGLVGCAWLGIHPLGSQAAGVRKWLVVRSLAGTTGLALYFYSITQLPLADAVGKSYRYWKKKRTMIFKKKRDV